MANIRVRKAIERVASDLDKIGRHVVQYSGIDPKDAPAIENELSQIIQMAGRLIEEAQIAGTHGFDVRGRQAEKRGVVKKLRKALGYTHP